MSYSILLKNMKGDLEEIPFSTNLTFEKYWSRKTTELNLELIQCFQYGYELTENDLLKIILEFETLKMNINEADKIERIDFILNELKKIRFSNYQSIYVG